MTNNLIREGFAMKNKGDFWEALEKAGLVIGAKYMQYLSNKYVAKAERVPGVDEKKHCYNKVLLYSGLKAVVESFI